MVINDVVYYKKEDAGKKLLELKNIIDARENKICLCSNCHNKLHYGADIDDMLFQIYEQRKEALSKFGINISFEELLSYYKRVD